MTMPPSETSDTSSDMTGAPALFEATEMGAAKADYEVLARKYRPRQFADLIGQSAMVRTLSNAFETGRIAHAFMLTGVRGVGKTTTARLLARGLNYRTEVIDSPSIALDPMGVHCQAIMDSRHPDILELDAASRTGVADMRELLEGVRYSPVSARYKVYIIDEVHMLSTAAFNALLKTLEEPPEHVKFIFATTEIRKVPVTVLSRCQRFDLKRLEVAELSAHLARIAKLEGGVMEEEGVTMIARAAEGSVRDGLSILDQALVQGEPGEPVASSVIRDMLGLADYSQLLDIFEAGIMGHAKDALEQTYKQIEAGADPLILLKDLLDICAEVSSAQIMGEAYQLQGPTEWAQRIQTMSKAISAAAATRYWQILLSGYRTAQTAPDMAVAARMVVIRLAAAASLPAPEELVAQFLDKGGEAAGTAGKPETPDDFTSAEAGPSDPPSLLAPSPQSSVSCDTAEPETPAAMPSLSLPHVQTPEDIVALMDGHKQAILSGDFTSYIRPVTIEQMCLLCDVKPGAPKDLLTRIADFLTEATDNIWRVERREADDHVETLQEKSQREQKQKIDRVAEHPVVQEAMRIFPGAEIVNVHGPADMAEK